MVSSAKVPQRLRPLSETRFNYNQDNLYYGKYPRVRNLLFFLICWAPLIYVDVGCDARLMIYICRSARLNLHKYHRSLTRMAQIDLKPKAGVLDPAICIELRHHEQKVLPKPNEKNILITSALPYVNNVPHLGNIIGCVLSADVFARYCRLRGHNTLYICGTDEYGTATETKALEEKISCQELCDKYFKLHKQVYEWFGIDFDFFGRTSTPKQTEIAQDIYYKLFKNGLIEERSITQLYSETLQRFLADRYVEGTCPYCGYEDARGDQCDNCQKLLNATELIRPRAKMDGSTPILKETDHLFLELPKLQQKCQDWMDKASQAGGWSDNAIAVTRSFLRDGLKERCITRDLKWGTPVPEEHLKNKVFYVWFDAPIGYLSITANYTDRWMEWWKNPRDVKLYQFMGKDNTPFHTIIFPCSLLGSGDEWTMLHHISTTEYLNYEGGKFSKSRNVGVFGNNVMESGIPVEVWRFYLLSMRPESSDTVFSWGDFITRNNSELLANLGNFVNRILKFSASKYGGRVPELYLEGWTESEVEFTQDINSLLQKYTTALDSAKLRSGLDLVLRMSSRGNEYLQKNKIDNTLFSEHRARCDVVLGVSLNLAYLLSAVVAPFMPTTSDAILEQMQLPMRRITDLWTGRDLAPNHQLGKPAHLFKRLDADLEAKLRSKYSGGSGSAKEMTASEAASGSAGKKKPSGGKSKPQLYNEIPHGVESTPELRELEEQVKAKGARVRDLKSEKAEQAKVQAAVEELLDVKRQFSKLIISKLEK